MLMCLLMVLCNQVQKDNMFFQLEIKFMLLLPVVDTEPVIGLVIMGLKVIWLLK